MKEIWKDYVNQTDTGYIAKKDFWAYRNKADGSFCMDFMAVKQGDKVAKFIVENEDIVNDDGTVTPMAYHPTTREIVSTVSQGVKYKDEVDWEKEQRQIDINKRNEYKQELKQATLEHLNMEVAVKDYASIESACSYATSSNPIYNAEGEQASAFRDEVWKYYYDNVENVEVLPEKDDYIAGLPPLGWN